MTFNAFWDLMRWLLLPGIGVLAWWININRAEIDKDLQNLELRQREDFARLEGKSTQDWQMLNRQHADFQIDVVSNYARNEQLERAFDRINQSLAKIDEKIEILRSEINKFRRVS